MPQTEPGSAYSDRRRKRRERPEPVLDLQTEAREGGTYNRVGFVERQSKGTLPPGITWALSQMPDNDRRLKKATRIAARRLDVPWHYLFGKTDPDDYIDPVTGQQGLSAKTIQRLTNNYSPLAIASLLKQESAGTTSEVQRREAGGVAPVNPVRVAKVARALTNAVGGADLKAKQAIALAGVIAREGVNPRQFADNLKAVDGFVTDTSRGQEFDFQSRAWIAMRATKAGKRFRNNLDVVTYLLPPDVQEQVKRGQTPVGNVSPRLGTITPEGQLAQDTLMQARTMATSREAADFFAQAKELENEIRLEKTAFERSWLGRSINTVSAPFNWFSEQVQKGIIEVSGVAVLGLSAAGLSSDKLDDETAFEHYQRFRHQWYGGLNNGNWLGSQIAEESGAPEWVGYGLDFAIGWYTDPTVIGGKVAQGIRSTRVFPGFLKSSTSLSEAARRLLPGGAARVEARLTKAADLQLADALDKFASWTKGADSKKLLRWAMSKEEGATARFLGAVEDLRYTYATPRPIAHSYLKALRDKMRQRFPDLPPTHPEVVQAWREGLMQAVGIAPPPGSVADDAARLLRGEQTKLRDSLASQLDELSEADAANVRELIDDLTVDPFTLPMFPEVPASGLSRFGPRRAVRKALRSDLVQSTRIGRRAGRLNVYKPQRYLNYHARPDLTTYELARYFRLPEKDARVFQSRVLEELKKGAGFEDRIDEIVEEVVRDGVREVARPYNIDRAVLDEFIEAHLNPIREVNAKLKSFGVEEVNTPEGAAFQEVTRPLFESQRRNFSFIPDPVQLETRVQQLVGAHRRIEQAFFRSLKRLKLAEVPKLEPDIARLGSKLVLTQERARELLRGYLRVWKAGAVARPAYVTRVVLLDEQLRFLTANQSLLERLLAQKSIGKLAGKLGTDKPFRRSLKLGDETVDLPLPFEQDWEAMASNTTRQAEVLNEIARRASEDYSALVKGGGWSVLEAPKNPKLHLTSWQRALTRDIANSPHGILALELVAAGKSLDDTVDTLKAFAHDPRNFSRLQRSGIISGTDDISVWAQQVAQTVHGYALGGTKYGKAVAQAALSQMDEMGEVLAKVPLSQRPPVHAPMVEDLMLGNRATPVGNAIVDKAYRYMVQLPEDVLNRQPFYRVWKSRAESAYLQHLEQVYRKNPEKLRQVREGIEAKAWPSASRGEFIETSDQLEAIWRAKEDQYWYHQTKADPADLQKTGLTPRFRLEADGTVRPWEGGSREARVYAAPAPEFSAYLTDQRAGPMLRFKRSATDFKPGMFAIDGTDVPAEFISTKGVPAKDIEFFGVDGEWHPLSDAAKTVRKPHPFQQAVHIASRDFALEQVRKVMFDFTRQSRFSELLQIIAPFPQPFFEGFQAWGHLVTRNPGVIGRARMLFELGKDTGFVFKDDNGEWSVKMGLYAKVARHLYLWDKAIGDTLSFTAPLDSFNMLSQSSIRLPEDGIMGKLVGGTYVPVPGLHAPLMQQLQHWLSDSSQEEITGYLFQYGAITPLIPKPVRVVLDNVRRAFGSTPDIPEERIRSYTAEIMKQYQAQGLDVDADGNKLSEAEVVEMARQQAIDLIMAQDVVSLFSPGALRAKFGHDEVEEEFNRRLEEDGATAAYDWLEKNHPDLSLIGIGKTYFTGAYTDAEGNPVSAGRPPSSEFFARLVTQPGFRKFARNHPEWVALLAVGIGADVAQDFDITTYSRQVRAGVLTYKRPEDYWAAGEDSKAWSKWYEWRRDQWVPGIEDLPEEVEEDDPAFNALRQRRRVFLTHLAVEHPGWARRHLQQAEDGTWDFGYDPDEGPASVIEVLADARAIVDTKGFENFPGVQALRAYLDGRDDIEERMHDEGIRSVYDSPKLEKEYSRVKEQALDLIPEDDRSTMERFFEEYFRGDLTNIRGYQDRKLEALKAKNPELYEGVVNYDTKVEVLSAKAQDQFEHNWERSQRYQDIRNYQERIWKNNPAVIRQWWKTLKPGEQEEYKETLVTRPSVFWSSHDWQVMGLKLSKRAAEWLNNMANARVTIQRLEDEDPTYSESEGYENIDREIRALRGKDKTFDAAVAAMSDWAFPLEAAGLHKHPGRAGEAWDHIIRGVRAVQEAADRGGWKGVDFGEETDRKYYAFVQDEFIKYVKEWQRYSPAFKEEWNTLKSALGGSLIEDLLIPDNYFGRLGDVDA